MTEHRAAQLFRFAVFAALLGAVSVEGRACEFSAATYTVDEFSGFVQVTVDHASEGPEICQIFAPGVGSASLGIDYEDLGSASHCRSFSPAMPGPWLDDVQIFDDMDVEPNETFEIRVARVDACDGNVLSAFDTATVTIVEDDGPATLRFGTPSLSMDESGFVSIPVERSGSQAAVGVDVGIAGGNAKAFEVSPTDADYDFQLFGACGRELCLESGQAEITFDVLGFFDDLAEGQEQLVLELENPGPGAVIGSPSIIFVTLSDAGVCTPLEDPAHVTEDAGQVTLVFTREGGAAGPLFCVVSTINGSGPDAATSPDDFTATSVELSWASGESSEKEVVVEIVDDEELEGDETFLVAREQSPEPSAPIPVLRPGPRTARAASSDVPRRQGASSEIAPTSAVVIADDEQSSVFRWDRTLAAANEGAGHMEVSVLRTGNVERAAAIDVTVVDDSAKEGEDFTVPVRTLTWEAGDGEPKTLRIDIVHDALDEPTEEAALWLDNPRETPPGEALPVLGSPSILRIRFGNLPRQSEMRFTLPLFAAFEGDPPLPNAAAAPNAALVVERAVSGQGAASVRVCIGEGSSASPEDFAFPSGTRLSWGSGETGPRALPVEVLDDAVIEGTELLRLVLCSPNAGSQLGEPAQAALVIGDDDVAVSEATEIAGPDDQPQHPVVVYDRLGRKIVVWQAEDGDGFGIFAQLFDEHDQPLGPPFRVNRSAAGNQTNPSVSFDDQGGFFVVFREQEAELLRTPTGRLVSAAVQGSSVLGRRFDPGAQATGNEVVVTSGDADSGQEPEVSLDKDGEAVVTWHDAGRPRGKVLGANDQPRTGELDLGAVDEACAPEVATAASGDFVTVWVEGPCNGGDDIGRVYARLFDDEGAPKSGAILVATAAGAAWAAVAIDETGRFAVVWQALGEDGFDVFARLFDETGQPLGPAFRVNQTTAGDQTRPRVDANAVFELAVVWQSSTTGDPGSATVANGSSVLGRVFDPRGEPKSGDIVTSTSEGQTEVANPDVSIENKDDVTVVWEKRGPGGEPRGIEKAVLEPSLFDGTCTADSETLCLEDSRFRVTLEWQDFEGGSDGGQAVPLTSDSGYTWFFDEENVEVIFKVLDACSVNGHYWVFAAGLTNVEVNLRVDDVIGGHTKTYFNSLGKPFQPILDTSAFPESCSLDTATAEDPAVRLAALSRELEELAVVAARARGVASPDVATNAASACAGDETTLCLGDGRFEVTVDWRSADAAGQGNAVLLTDDSGTFWFFDEDNVEIVVKTLAACGVNGHYWVFAAGLTDVETLLTVTDTVQPRSQSYATELGTPFAPVLDVEAFECGGVP